MLEVVVYNHTTVEQRISHGKFMQAGAISLVERNFTNKMIMDRNEIITVFLFRDRHVRYVMKH